MKGDKSLAHTGFIYKFAAPKKDDEKGTCDNSIEYNEDGTLSVDVYRTGNWFHWWYGRLSVTNDDLDQVIVNFENNVIGYRLTFNYHHLCTKNFGEVARLRKEERFSKFTQSNFTMLVADVILTEDGKKDVESGEVLNFSSEVNPDYIHRQLKVIPVLNEDGTQATDEEGNPINKSIAIKYGHTLLGGAVTNHPFIDEMNTNGLGGNAKAKDLKFSQMLVNPQDIDFGSTDVRAMCFSTDGPEVGADTDNEIEYEDAISVSQLHGLGDVVLVGNCYYDAATFKASDVKLSDGAFGKVFEITGETGETFKVRKERLLDANSTSDSPSVDLEAERSMDGSKSPTQIDLNSPEFIQLLNDKITERTAGVEQKYSDQIVKLEATVTELTESNKSLFSQVNTQRELTAKAHARAVEADVAKFADTVMGGKATPALKSVIRCGLRGNDGVKVKYFDTEKKEFSEITLREYTHKLLSCDLSNEADEDTQRLSDPPASGTGELEISDPKPGGVSGTQTYSDNFAGELMNNEEAFVDFMSGAGFGGGKGLVSKTLMARKAGE